MPDQEASAGRRGPAALGWLMAPATEDVPRAQAVGAACLRILVGLLWLYNVTWKRPPDFGEEADSGLYHFTAYAVSHPVFPPYSWVVENLVLPVFTPFGWLVLAAETALAVLLLTGSWVRLAAALGLAQSLAIGLSVAYAPNEWPWSYWLMIGAHGVLLVSSAGRVLAVDSIRAGLSTSRLLGTVWGAAAILIGAFSVVGSLDDPLAARGSGLASADPSLSLGTYNLVGGLVLVLAGALLLVSARGGPRWAARATAGICAVAALTLYAQVGFSDPVLGGSATSAAMLLSIAVVALFVAAPSHSAVSRPDLERNVA